MSRYSKQTSEAGFTIAELTVAIAIMIAVTTMIIFNYRGFNSNVVLTNLAYDVGLSIRKAQTYGINVKGVTEGTSQNYGYPYGVVFNISVSNAYSIFVDKDRNGIYTSGADTLLETYYFRGGYRVRNSGLCTLSGAVETCNHGRIYVSFLRPNPDAIIRVANLAGVPVSPAMDAVMIKLGMSSDSTAIKKIIIRPTGQISIE